MSIHSSILASGLFEAVIAPARSLSQLPASASSEGATALAMSLSSSLVFASSKQYLEVDLQHACRIFHIFHLVDQLLQFPLSSSSCMLRL